MKNTTKTKQKPSTTASKPYKFRIAHSSLQFDDSSAQHTADIEKVFSQDFDAITGTEAGANTGNVTPELKRLAKKHGYKINVTGKYDTWVAIHERHVSPRTFRKGARFILWRATKIASRPPGRWGDKGIVWAQAVSPLVGKISIGSMHPLTKKGAGLGLKRSSDRRFAAIGYAWAKKAGVGPDVVFLNGDMNTVDRTNDVFHGHPLTTCWDEMGYHPNTGHGNIDVVSSLDADKNVKCVSARVFDDRSFFLHGDHHLVVATYEIQKEV